jgi:hypothetical protein
VQSTLINDHDHDHGIKHTLPSSLFVMIMVSHIQAC